MEAARPRTDRRRPRRGSVDRPIDTRLVRSVGVVLAVPLLLVLLTMARPGPLPAPALPPSFDAATAVALTREFSSQHARRVPGTLDAANAALWFQQKIEQYGLKVEEDAWTEGVPGLGRVKLRNLAVVIPGAVDETIVVVAHRDNIISTAGANDDASGTAALIELARGYATVGTGGAQPRRPLHTIVLLSSDAGAYGSEGVERFSRTSRFRQRVTAAVVLDGLAGRATPRIELSGLGRTSPTPALVRTLAARVAAATGRAPEQPSLVRQLVALGLPFGVGEQAPLLRRGIPAVRLSTSPDAAPVPGSDEVAALDTTVFTRLGAAVDATLGSLDAAVELPRSTAVGVFLGGRTVRGWALELLFLASLAPFVAGAFDLAGRCRRRQLSLLPGWLALRRLFGWWLAVALAVAVATVLGAFPGSRELPPTPADPALDRWPAIAVALVAFVAVAAWLRNRTARARPRNATSDEVLAGWGATLLGLVAVAVVTAIASPYTLVFVLPSLYAWLLVPHVPTVKGWLPDVLFGVGLAGPIVAVMTLAHQLDLGFRAPLYAISLCTTGTVPWLATLALVGWAAVATQVATLVSGAYAPVGPPSKRR
jgi:Peptidase family M28